MSRAGYARLYSAGFPDILDRHNNPPEVVDPNATVEYLNMPEALADPLQVCWMLTFAINYFKIF